MEIKAAFQSHISVSMPQSSETCAFLKNLRLSESGLQSSEASGGGKQSMLTQAHEILMVITLPLTLDSFFFFPFLIFSAVKQHLP